MILDAQSLPQDAVVQADICIAGAGAAGMTLARELSGRGLQICLLEGGGFDPEENGQDPYRGEDVGAQQVALHTCRLRYLGGTTNHWSGWCRRLLPEVFQARSWIDEGWPFDYQTLAPYYELAHRTCQIGANEFDAQVVGDRAGLTTLPLDATRVQSILYQYSPPTRFGSHYRPDLENAADITTYLHANLVNIAMTQNGQAIESFDCVSAAGTPFQVVADTYVIAMGGIENARILLASNRQASKGVGNDNDNVGRYFMEHPHYYFDFFVVLDDQWDVSFYNQFHRGLTVDGSFPNGLDTIYRAALALAPEVCVREQLPFMACTIGSVYQPEMEPERTGAIDVERIRTLMRLAENQGASLYKLELRAEQRPIPDSRITLLEDLDGNGVPRVRMDWRIAEQDRADAQRTMALISAEMARNGLGRVFLTVDDDERFLPTQIVGGCHHMGSTRMNQDPTKGVVDGNCRVHGLDNLYVAGSSVFPTGGYANPTLTLVALAHRLAEHLATEVMP